MTEKLTQLEEPRILSPEQFVNGFYKLEPSEKVIITSDFSDNRQLTINGPVDFVRDPINYASVVGLWIGDVESGDENKFDKFEIIRYPDKGAYAIRAVNHAQEDSIPVPLFNLGDGLGILGRKGRPLRNGEVPFIAHEHVQITVENDQLMITNLNPHFPTVLINNQASGQFKFPELSQT